MNKTILAILAITMMAIMLIPVQAFVFPNCSSDASFEQYGPRADKLLIHLYANDGAEFSAMEGGLIDICDWPLSKQVYLVMSAPPYNNTIKIINYGAEYGLYIIDFNCNNNTYMGNPPDPANGNNPMVVNSTASGSCPHGCWTSDVWLRRAIDYLINRPVLVSDPSIGAGFGYPLYTTIPPPLVKYLLDITTTNATWAFTYSQVLCNATLNAHGYIEGPSWTLGLPMPNHVAREYIGPGNYATLTQDKLKGSTRAYVDNAKMFIPYIGQDVWICNATAPPYKPGEWHTVVSVTVTSPSGAGYVDFGQPDQFGYDAHTSRLYAAQLFEIEFYIRSDHPGRLMIGTVLTALMEQCNIWVTTHFENSGGIYVDVMENKNFHMCTGGWSLSSQPDYLILWDWAYYWHPGFCYNYGGCNNAKFNYDAEAIMYANSQAEAVAMALDAQFQQAYWVLGAPVYCVSGNKAVSYKNVGGNAWDPTEGQAWAGWCNTMGYGCDTFWSMLDMHTVANEWNNGMTIDYGFKVPELKDVNIIYANFLYDLNVLGEIYESLLASNSSNVAQIIPWIAWNWTVGTYEHPTYGTCSKVTFSLRPDVCWSDGYPLTLADVYFSFVEIKADLAATHHPKPWWWSNVQDILSFTILDPYSFEVLLDVKSYWALYWIGGSYILPKHIWKPIIMTGDPEKTFADPNVIGSGPWLFNGYVAENYVLLCRNPNFHRSSDVYITIKANPSFVNKCTPAEGLSFPNGTGYLWVTVYDMDDPSMHPYGMHFYITIWQEVFILPTKGIWLVSDRVNGVPVAWDLLICNMTLYIDAGWHVSFPVSIGEPWSYGLFSISDIAINFYPDDPHYYWYLPPKKDVGDSVSGLLPTDETLPGTWQILWSECWGFGMWWFTIKEDIAGGWFYSLLDPGFVYPYKTELPCPDFKVDIYDVARVCAAFGTYPGMPRWNTLCDLNHDYKIDIKDVARVAARFGWHAVPNW
jgi:ABC-type transport system substrate-binding protein